MQPLVRVVLNKELSVDQEINKVSDFIIDTIVNVLGYRVELDRNSSLEDIYMDSLDVALLVSNIESEYNVTFEDNEIRDLLGSIRILAEHIVTKSKRQ